jgi:ankyrin repeat protein
VASFMGCMNIVIYLIQHEANPDVPTVRGETPLHLAARANQTDIIRILLRNGAQVDARARVMTPTTSPKIHNIEDFNEIKQISLFQSLSGQNFKIYQFKLSY